MLQRETQSLQTGFQESSSIGSGDTENGAWKEAVQMDAIQYTGHVNHHWVCESSFNNA